MKRAGTEATSGDEASAVAEEGFLQRFSRRKHEARLAESEVPPVAEQAPDPEPAVALTDDDMPPIESLDESSDYSVFLSEKVSESLRRSALRKLFHSSAFNVIDELDDYAEDFTTFEALGNVITAEMRHRLEIEARRQAEALAENAGSQDATPDTAVADTDTADDDLSTRDDAESPAATPAEPPLAEYDEYNEYDAEHEHRPANT
ncbi:MAG: DUF3306 domain-containing protein [Gammaproteobacteria bacterium]|nr:DUF3306 domain-containing protein [Gammaproteobacteria bacterium]